MVFQIAGAILLPIVMLMVAAAPFDEPIEVQPTEPVSRDVGISDYVIFFILWAFWILILTRIVYHMGKTRFKIQKES